MECYLAAQDNRQCCRIGRRRGAQWADGEHIDQIIWRQDTLLKHLGDKATMALQGKHGSEDAVLPHGGRGYLFQTRRHTVRHDLVQHIVGHLLCRGVAQIRLILNQLA